MSDRQDPVVFDPSGKSEPLVLQVRRCRPHAQLPRQARPGDAGLDLCAAQACTLRPLQRKLIPTGVQVAIPAGFAGFVMPRSGNALRLGLSFPNTPGLIDSGYRGELQAIAINLDPETPLSIEVGDRIAQLVILPVPALTVCEVAELDETERGAAGFGSSGMQ
ncbi:MAG: dUTP diphosphatase [Coriobacteriia bacterium]|nr:dUTP diphosphatase [Coriobacteriia bacterium]